MKPRIIVLDDDELIRMMLEIMLKERDCEVVTCTRPSNCMIYLKSDCACPRSYACTDILITDINMPGMSGFEFIEHMTNHGCKAMAQNKAVMSGHLSNEALSTAKRLGCQTFQKPIRKDELFAWLDKCEKRIDPSRKLVDLANLLPQA